MYSCLYYRGIIFFRDIVYRQVRTMSEHSPEFITSEFTVSTNNATKVAAVKAALAANVHVFVFIYMDNCGHCMGAEAAWVDFTKEANKRSNAEAFAVSRAVMGEFETALGDVPAGFPTFRCVHNGKVTDYNDGRSVSELIEWMDGTIPSQPQSGGKKTTKKNPIAKPLRISSGITSTGARKGPTMGTAMGHPTPIAQHVPPFGVGGGCRQKGGTNKTKKNTFTKPPRQQTSVGRYSTGARKGPIMGTATGHPTPMAQHMPTLVPTYVPPFATNIGGRRKKGSRKRRKTRKARKTRKSRKTRKARKTRKTKRRR
jgi:hypothetical protein